MNIWIESIILYLPDIPTSNFHTIWNVTLTGVRIDEVDDNGDDDASIDDDGIEIVVGLATNTSRWNDVSAQN